MLLPLVPSIHSSARFAENVADERQEACLAILERDHHTCQFCGLPAGSWQDVFHRNDDHADWSSANLAAACPLCHGTQHIGSASANLDMRIVWLPEVTQNLLNVLVRGIHHVLHAHGISPTLTVRPVVEDPELACAWRAYMALDHRAASAESVIDTDRPNDLAAALQVLSPTDYARRAQILGGLRLLHRGRVVRDGHDSYPAQLDLWSKPAGTPVSPAAT